ncbi:MAG: hypothetical protein E7L05_15760, partial [Clostridium sp.]|nr:hypothetical protein [Clostridium sp.]
VNVQWAGFTLVKETINPLLGEAPDPELAKNIREMVLSYDHIIGVHDLIIHNYGVGKCMASIHAEIPSDKDIEQSFNEAGTVIYHIILEGKKVGGAVININELTQHNSLELFFIYKSEHSHGLGYKAWKAIEKQYPETKIWETCTPYFEKRNIHFYVNKCGFKIVEYFNKNNPDPHAPEYEDLPGSEELFRFEKIMKK